MNSKTGNIKSTILKYLFGGFICWLIDLQIYNVITITSILSDITFIVFFISGLVLVNIGVVLAATWLINYINSRKTYKSILREIGEYKE